MLNPSQIKPAVLYGLLGCSLALNLVMVFERGSAPSTESSAPEEGAAPVEGSPSTAAPVAPTAPAAPLTALASATPAAAAPAGDWLTVSGDVNRSISDTFSNLAPGHGDALSQTYARLFVWDVDLRRDLQRGDKVEVVYRVISDAEMEIAAARLVSQKLGKTISAYRWQAPGDAFPSYWHDDGVEVPYRLKGGPLKDYEQITSLLKDRPTHEGMDFKTPSGTPVISPKDGVVTRVNWNWGSNGNCIEVRYSDGVMAKFLHLSEGQVAEGDSVHAGQQVALTGNTGHSTAPHLHYQLNRGESVLDPIDYHGAERRQLTPEAFAAFNVEKQRLDAELGRVVASN